VTTKKASATGNFELQDEAAPANGIVCTAFPGQGIIENTAGSGVGSQSSVFEKCKGLGAFAFCQQPVGGVVQTLNGTERLEGSVTTEAVSSNEQEITPHGFNIACAQGDARSKETTVDLGEFTGAIVGHTVAPKQNELEFNKAKARNSPVKTGP
jgi:hypothetical protein